MRFSTMLILMMTLAAGLSACGDSSENTNNSADANNLSDGGVPDSGTPDADADTTPECDAETANLLDYDVSGEDVTLTKCTLVTERVAIGNDGSVTVVPGSTLLFEQNAGFWVAHDGVLNAVGTSDEPILFTATDKQPGFWRDVYFENSESSENALEYVTMEYAGSDDRPALRVQGRATVTVRNNTIRNSAAAGFYLQQNTSAVPTVTFENNTVTENGLAGVSNPIVAGAIDASNDLSGNTVDRVEIESLGAAADLTTSTTYQNIGIPYLYLSDFKVHGDATWTVDPGVEILMDGNTRIVIGHDGILTVDGTSDEPITIRGKESVAGYWQELYIEKSASPSNVLRHVVIQDAGSGGDENASAVHLASGSNSTTRLTFDQVTIRDSAKHGVYSNDGFEGAFDVSGCDTITFEGIAGDEFAGDPICN